MAKELIGPGRMGPEIKGPNFAGPSPDELEAEIRAHEAQPARHHERVVIYSLLLTQMHLYSLSPSHKHVARED